MDYVDQAGSGYVNFHSAEVESKCQVCSRKWKILVNCNIFVNKIFIKDVAWNDIDLEKKLLKTQKEIINMLYKYCIVFQRLSQLEIHH